MIVRQTTGVVSSLLIVAALSGCVTAGEPKLTPEEIARQDQAIEALAAGKADMLRPRYADVVRQGDREAVLNWMRLGKLAMDFGHTAEAAEAFDEALKRISAVYADDPQAEKARSVWHAESVKDFKGEPYERAMAFHYRGVLDMVAGDYENARASFKGALIQDSFAELERHRQDFASAAWLVGWTSRCLGDDVAAAEAFAEAREFRPDLPLPEDKDRLLVILEAGQGPEKEAVGEHLEQLAYRERREPKGTYTVTVGKTTRQAVQAEDLFVQATTRGGRQMDEVLALKAGTKETTSAVGTGATAVGLGVMAHGGAYNDGNVAAAGLVVTLLGLAAQAAAESMIAEADTRHWSTLPHSLYLTSLPRGKVGAVEDIAVSFDGASESVLTGAGSPLYAQGEACDIAWFPSRALKTYLPTDDAQVSESSAAGAAEIGNCLTSTGKTTNLHADVCRSIDGTVLADVPRQDYAF